MKNVEMSGSGNILTITVDLTKEFGPSSSGKTIIIASTEGNARIPEREEVVGLNVYRKKEYGDLEHHRTSKAIPASTTERARPEIRTVK
jgi:hypothetical protein